MTVSRTATPSATTTATSSWRRASRRASSRLAVIIIQQQQQQQQKQLTDNTVDPNCPRCGQPPQTLEHWLDCPGTLLARLEIFGTTEAPPLSRLSSFPGKSVALARRTLWRLGAHAIITPTPPPPPPAAAAASAEKPLDTGHCMHATTRPTRITHRLNECSCARLLVWVLVLQNGPAYITARLSFHRLMTQDHSCVCVCVCVFYY